MNGIEVSCFSPLLQVPCKLPCLILWMITQALNNNIAPSALPTAGTGV